MKSSWLSLAHCLLVIAFVLVLSGLISITAAKTAVAGYYVLFAGIVITGIGAACATISTRNHSALSQRQKLGK